MQGHSHALSGAAVFLLAAAPPTTATTLPPVALVCLTVCAAGAAMGPDSDHPRASIAHSLPPLSRWVCQLISWVSGGHRHATHAPLMLPAVYLAGWSAVHWWSHPVPQLGVAVPPGGLLLVLLLTAFGVKALRLVRGHSWPVAALVTCVAGWQFTTREWGLLPAVLTVGWAAHILGDFLAPEGIPLFWPWHPAPPGRVPESAWGTNGYLRVPVLNSAGADKATRCWWLHPVRWLAARREAAVTVGLAVTVTVVGAVAAARYAPPGVVGVWLAGHY